MSAIIDVSSIVQSPGSHQDIHLRLDIPELKLGDRLLVMREPVRVDGEVESVGTGVLVRGELKAKSRVDCVRCLSEFELVIETVLEELFAKPSAKHVMDEEEFEDAFAIVDGKIDIEPAVEQALLIEVPFKPLCRVDCAGLCPVCGKNLNEEPHECPKAPIDVRMSKLVELKETLEKQKRRRSS